MPSEATAAADALKGRVRCIVVTPEKAVLDEIAELVILPMFDGELGVCCMAARRSSADSARANSV